MLSFKEGPRTFLNEPINKTVPENLPGHRNVTAYELTLIDQYWAHGFTGIDLARIAEFHRYNLKDQAG